MCLEHLADGVHRAGGHWEISDRSNLRGATLPIREEKRLCAGSLVSV